MVTMTPEEFERWCGRVADDLEDLAHRTVHEALHDVHLRALDLSSGPFTRKELRRRPQPDHPYARRHGSPRYDPARTNIQSGELATHWEAEGPVESEGDWLAILGNTSLHAAYLDAPPHDRPDERFAIYLGGNAVAFGRPLPDRVIIELEPVEFDRFQQAVVQLLQP